MREATAPVTSATTSAEPAPSGARPPSLPPTLPTAAGRLAAVAVACAASTSAAWIVGAEPKWWVPLAMTFAAALLLVTIALGVRVRTVLTAALLTLLAFGLLLLAPLPGMSVTAIAIAVSLPPAAVIASLILVLRGVPDPRSLGSGLRIGAAVVLAATAWPVLALVALVSLLPGLGASESLGKAPALAALAVAPLAWLLAGMGGMSALSAGAMLATLRDAAFRVLAILAALAATLWTGAGAEDLVRNIARDTTLESAAPSAGWVTALALFAVLGWGAWQLPRWLTLAQLRGRFDSRAVGEALLFLALSCLGAFAAWRLAPDLVLGRACWVAIAGGAAYAACRLWFAAPVQARNAPLWIVMLDAASSEARRVAPLAAARWRTGQVTLLAAPRAAGEFGGEHLRAATQADEAEALFPLRAVHLEDWREAQPRAWRALPVRELYAATELWPRILGEQPRSAAQILALGAQAASGDAPKSFRERLRRLIRSEQVVGYLVPRSRAAALRPGADRESLLQLGAEVIEGEERLLRRLAELQPRPEPTIFRHVMMLASPEHAALADRLSRLLQGERDREGRVVECWVLGRRRGMEAIQRLVRMQLGLWRHSALLFARLIQEAEPRGGLRGLYVRLLLALMGRHWTGEFELVALEGSLDARKLGLPLELIERGVRHGVAKRVVAVRSPGTAAAGRLTFPAPLYSGEIRIAPGEAIDTTAEHVARRLLALDFLPVSAPATASEAEVEPTAENAPRSVASQATDTAQRLSGGATDTPSSSEERKSCWWLAPLLPLLGVGLSLGSVSFSFQYLAVPLAAWVGYRFPRSGIYALGVGLLPLLYGSPSFGGFRLEHLPGLYLVSLLVCWAFSNPGRWWRGLEAWDVTVPLIVCVFAVGGSMLILSGAAGQLGWRGHAALIAFGAFLLGLTGKRLMASVVVATACATAGTVLNFFNRFYREDLGGGLWVGAAYFFDSPAELLFALVLLGFGRMMWKSAHEQSAQPLPASKIGPLFAVLWIAATHSLSIRAGSAHIGLLGGTWFIVSLAFIAGAMWQQRGMAVVAAALLFAAVEWVVAAGLLDRTAFQFEWLEAFSGNESASRPLLVSLGLPDWLRQSDAYLATIPFCYLGMRLARGLGFTRGLGTPQPLAERWLANSGAGAGRARREATPSMAFAFIPVVALLPLYYHLSRNFGFHFEYLIIPTSAWLAWRYGRAGFIAFAIGAITYWIGFWFGPIRLRLSTDLYVVGFLVGWAASHPGQLAKAMHAFRPSYLGTLAIVGLLPASITLWTSFGWEVGWQTYHLFPFAVLLLGYGGVPARMVIPLIAVLGLATYAWGGSLSVGPLRFYYALYGLSGIISTTLWYLAGLALRHVFLEGTPDRAVRQSAKNESTQEDRVRGGAQAIATWLRSGGGYLGLGLLMLIAPVRIAVSGVGIVSGWTPLLVLGAFMAGLLWTWRGLHLTAAVVAALCVLPPYFFGRDLGWDLGSLQVSIHVPPPSFLMVALPALLYTVMGMRMAASLARQQGESLASAESPP